MYESADQHKLEAELIKNAFDELRVKHEIKLAQAHYCVWWPKNSDQVSRNRGTGVDVCIQMLDARALDKLEYGIFSRNQNLFTIDHNIPACCTFLRALF
ncbi:hypothetical protein J3R83DRAFT_3754 [Lanmaoa asiatica]|nr:hypothetical protein J3R83DRAFT_3754 [Lanmaoa asiatica]